TGAVCSGHGTCSDGNAGDGTCTCASGFYGADCSVSCTKQICAAAGLVHSQCTALNGTCECQYSQLGFYSGPTCDDCATGFWGWQCSAGCLCNGKGSCDRTTGACSCFRSPTTGYWGGDSCTECATGYIGLECRSLNIQLSVAAAISAAVATTNTAMST